MKPQGDMEETLRRLESPAPESLRARVLERAGAAIEAVGHPPRSATLGSASWLAWAAAALALALANVFSDRVLPLPGGTEEAPRHDEPTVRMELAQELGFQELRPFSIARTTAAPTLQGHDPIRALLEEEDLF